MCVEYQTDKPAFKYKEEMRQRRTKEPDIKLKEKRRKSTFGVQRGAQLLGWFNYVSYPCHAAVPPPSPPS